RRAFITSADDQPYPPPLKLSGGDILSLQLLRHFFVATTDRKGKTAAVLKSRTRKRRYSRLFLRLLCRHGLDFVQRNEIRGIDAGIARRAIGRLLSFGASLAQAFQREIRQRVGANVVADFFHRFIGSD